MTPNPGNHIRVAVDFHPSVSAIVRFYAFVGTRIRAFVRKHGCVSADARIRPEAQARPGRYVRFCNGADRGEADIPMERSLLGDMTMNHFITDDERAQLLANGQARATARDTDPMPVVKLFTPDAHAIWLLAALDPADGDTAWGLCDVGIGMPELGTVQLSALASIVGPQDRPVLRDQYFRPAQPLSEYARLAQLNGSILD
jgi:hypothetical protein